VRKIGRCFWAISTPEILVFHGGLAAPLPVPKIYLLTCCANEGIGERIAQFVSLEHQRAACEQFFLTVALSCAIGNGDAHLKNFAVLYENPEAPVRLAPSYDLVCTTLYQAHDVLALTLDDSKSFPNRERLTTFAHTTCNLTGATAADLLNRVLAGVRRAVKDIRRYSREHSDFASAGAKLIAAFERGAASVAS
jgi:serine/threonine-protein kinase HipA